MKDDSLIKFIVKDSKGQKKGGKDKKAMRRAERERLREGEAADEEQKKLKKDAKNKSSSSSTRSQDNDFAVAVDEDDEDDDVQWQTNTSMEAAKQRMQAQLSTATAQMVMLSTDETDKKKKKAQDVSNGNGAKATLYDELVEGIKAKVVNKAATAAQLKIILSSSTLPPQDTMNALLEALFHGIGKGFAKEVVKRKDYLAAAVCDDEDNQALLLHALEAFCDRCSAEAVKEVPVVLKALYDRDVMEEEAIDKWYEEAVAVRRKSEMLEKAKPFVEWLQSADSEEEEE